MLSANSKYVSREKNKMSILHCRYRVILLALLSFCFACTSSKRSETGKNKVVAHIESNLFEITRSGADTGSAYSVSEGMKKYGIPGMSIAVFDQGKIIWAKGYGFSDKELNQLVNPSTIFQAASISKPVTSVASFRLIEKGFFNLDENINTYLKRWKVPENEYTVESKVTLRGIISHTAGLSVHGFYGYGPKDTIPTITQVLDGLRPSNSEPTRVFIKPGTRESYSGGGFTVLQLAIEEITGQSFYDAMDELVLFPAGMRNSKFSLKVPLAMQKNAAKGYRKNGDMVEGGYHIYPEQAAAGLWTTPSDLAEFMLNVGNSYRTNQGLLQQSTVRKMFIKIPGAGGLGFGIDGKNDSLRFRHSGGNEGYSCYAVSFAEAGRGVVIMTNSDNGTPFIREFLRAISKEYKWPPMWPRE
jgi:CubicO group peptidase (beta-lactamase class C family)